MATLDSLKEREGLVRELLADAEGALDVEKIALWTRELQAINNEILAVQAREEKRRKARNVWARQRYACMRSTGLKRARNGQWE